MVGMGEHDELENRYKPEFEALISKSGLVVEYRFDRAGLDTGLHLFARGSKTSRSGKESPYWRPVASRVWFQLKGMHETTLSAEEFAKTTDLPISVEVDHLKYWYAAPEPVYLVVYVESVDAFFGVDVRELVERRWGKDFYSAMREHGAATITVHVPTDSQLDAERIASLVEHRSMRIDGPTFRGRPLGHRIDPLRSVLMPPPADLWQTMIERLLEAHEFIQRSRRQVGQLSILHGILGQTLLWQSPAFAEYGFSPGQEVRDEPNPEVLVGSVYIVLDAADSRRSFTSEERQEILSCAKSAVEDGVGLAVAFRAPDLSGIGGLWSSTLRDAGVAGRDEGWHEIGLEALTYLVLVSTLVYLDFAPDLEWDHANYLS